jgi:hypothetical protein
MCRCEMYLEKNFKVCNGMEGFLQGNKDGRDEELVFFSREADPRVTEDRKHMKLQLKGVPAERMGARVTVKG